jgi:hypothetical protein
MFSQGFFQEPTNMITEGAKNVSPAYSAWVDKHVVLLIRVRQYFVPMPCSIIGETDDGVRVCIQPGWELEIRKELILAVEEATPGREANMN